MSKFIPTPHISVSDINDFAPTVIMPGDPLRSKFIAEHFLYDTVLISQVRGVLAYTGFYKNKRISVMASGIGMASMGIYSYELFNFYKTENIIRVGSCGTYTEDIRLRDIFLVTEAWSESTFAYVQGGYTEDIMPASAILNIKIRKTAEKKGVLVKGGRVHCSDVFYQQKSENYKRITERFQCQVVEMETFALFANAKASGKQAAALLTVSDNLVVRERLSAKERQEGFERMITLALESC